MKFILLTHARELSKKTNTGRLVKQVLGDDAKIIVWQRTEPDDHLVNLLTSKKAALVFPCKEPRVSSTRLMQYEYFVILDGTWQEARKMFNRSEYLKQAELVSLNDPKPSEFRLRRNQIEGGLSTAECVIELLRQYQTKEKLPLLEAQFKQFNH